MLQQRQILDNHLQRLVGIKVGRHHRLGQGNVEHLQSFELTDCGNFTFERPHVEQYQRLQLRQMHQTVETEIGEQTSGEVEIGEFH